MTQFAVSVRKELEELARLGVFVAAAALRRTTDAREIAAQMLHELWVSGANWCDWLSYNPDFPEELQAKLVRVYASDLTAALEQYDVVARKFLEEVDEQVRVIHRMAADAGAPVF